MENKIRPLISQFLSEVDILTESQTRFVKGKTSSLSSHVTDAAASSADVPLHSFWTSALAHRGLTVKLQPSYRLLQETQSRAESGHPGCLSKLWLYFYKPLWIRPIKSTIFLCMGIIFPDPEKGESKGNPTFKTFTPIDLYFILEDLKKRRIKDVKKKHVSLGIFHQGLFKTHLV